MHVHKIKKNEPYYFAHVKHILVCYVSQLIFCEFARLVKILGIQISYGC